MEAALMELPRALSPWGEELSLFPVDLAIGLGDLVRRLALFLGPMRTDRTIALADGSGFDGIDSRGSYERLLLSEWLLADELPDEFTRRAASGEHMFLRPARRGPSNARTSVVLFDAGPSQLGSPRVAHLALLIVLARRAAAANAAFRWGILQSNDRALREDVTRESLLALVGAATTRPVGDVGQRLGEFSRSDEVWIVGGEGAMTAAASTVLVRDVLALDRRSLSLEVRPLHAPVRRATLDLPSERDTARLLRDPFGVAKQAPAPAAGIDAPRPPLMFADNGSKVYARTALGVISIPVPNSPRAGVGRVKIQQTMEIVAAVGRGHRRPTLVVARSDGRLATVGGAQQDLGRFTSDENDETAPFAPSEDDPLRPLLLHGNAVGFVDSQRRLFELRFNGTRLIGRDVLAANPLSGGGYVFVGRPAAPALDSSDEAWTPIRLCRVSGDLTTAEPLSHSFIAEAFLTTDRARSPLVALGAPGMPYGIFGVDACKEITPPADHRVVAVHRLGDAAGLLVIDPTRRELLSVTPASTTRHLGASGTILHCAVDPAAHTAALLVNDGRVVLYSIAQREYLHTFEFGSKP